MILPGRTIGILGGGQLGRMLAVEARRMGYRVCVLDPTPHAPAAQVSDEHIPSPVDDVGAALALAKKSDVVTLEWELIPSKILKKLEKVKPLHPSSKVLEIIQDRLAQKRFLKRHGFPQAPFVPVDSLEQAVREIGLPSILKRRFAGYDGKGQCRLETQESMGRALETLKELCVLEEKISFQKEISVVLARGEDGRVAVYPAAENVHRNGILHTTLAPARISPATRKKAERLATSIAKALGHVGVMAVEMFLLKDGKLLVNEIAPRVHNSGHHTLGACETSQFEQHIRAVCGLPFGDTRLLCPVVMVNLMGDLWKNGEPRWDEVLKLPNARLHLYGKHQAKPGRKMGHLLILGKDINASLRLADSLLSRLQR